MSTLKILRSILNGILVGALLVQSTVLFAFLTLGYVEIPGWSIRSFSFLLTGGEHQVSMESFRIYPDKGIIAENVTVYSENCRCPAVRIQSAWVSFRDKKSGIETRFGGINGGTVFYPDPFLPESENLKLIENINMSFSFDDESLKIRSLDANVAKLQVSSRRAFEIPHEFWDPLQDDDDERENDNRDWAESRKELLRIHDYFNKTEFSTLDISLSYQTGRGFDGEYDLFTEGGRALDKLSNSSFYLTGKFNIDEHFHMLERVYGGIESIAYGNEYRIGSIDFFVTFDSDQINPYVPDEVKFHARKLSVHGREIDFLSGTVAPQDLYNSDVVFDVGIGDQSLRGEIDLNTEEDLLHWQVSGSVAPLKIADQLDFETEGVPLKFADQVWLNASGSVTDWKTLDNLEFALVTQNLELKGVGLEYARGLGRLEADTLFIDGFSIRLGGARLRGLLSKNFENTEYRYLIEGKMFPYLLNPMFKPWWEKTWTSFDFSESPAYADMDIWGKADDQRRRNAFGEIAFDEVAYKGLMMKRGELRLQAISKYTRLYDMQIRHPEGFATGEVRTVYQPDGKLVMTQRYNVASDIPLHRMKNLLGESLEVYVDNASENAAPHVNVEGCLVKDEFPELEKLERMKVEIASDASFEFFGVEMDRLNATILSEGDQILIHPVSYGFADGVGTGSFRMLKKGDETILEFQTELQDFNYHIGLNKISALKDEEEPFEEEVKEEKVRESYMDLWVEGQTPIGKWGELRGEGRFELRDPLIHRVHVFGGFSKVMDNAELNLGSFSLKEASSPLKLEGTKVFFEDLELTGPSSRVKSKGFIDLGNQTLDFRMKAYPLGEVKFPVVALLAFTLQPITHLFEVRATGSIEDPDWKFQLDPSGL